ncbi:GTP pyrophosphokinase family protein [Pseudoalteromonas sp. SG43-5]|uniref:GTP pyrophosphokinase n=1 Tax=Pseudoalteromonas sp. SG43-5 TaxID=2760968 RepID=UPI001601FB56|nr:RelA/SpoT domain-containing protein [Pseudoalteromonas sp. SG43-5]MBB1455687.1 RelA/SpoT domain-containing protein [Pseudoalteromonas sp. SG43-5]
MDKELIKIDYDNHKPNASRFMSAIIEQLNGLVEQNDVTLGTAIESRIKTFNSIEGKLLRKNKSITSITDLDDLVGLRIIVLFKSDIVKVCNLIKKHFDVVEQEDTSERLSDDQFGYHSTHYTVKLPNDWLKLPTLQGLELYKAEIQIRTLSQHTWAVASHKLQYKQEDNVPVPLRRSINRVSALLETVDLEFERLLVERHEYVEHINDESSFNVDVLEKLCDQLLPAKNKHVGHENYAEFLAELALNGINKTTDFIKIVNAHLSSQIQEDQSRVINELQDPQSEDLERLHQGVFYTHIGLARGCLHEELGENHRYVTLENN